ncbi:hypothetical protein Areg01_89870 [Actinoplanes regularis]|nr:hypothetical protein Areg01_89870 [Actinoplanes regularis]
MLRPSVAEDVQATAKGSTTDVASIERDNLPIIGAPSGRFEWAAAIIGSSRLLRYPLVRRCAIGRFTARADHLIQNK